ncbi:MAG: nitrite reductase small subunit NirD [Solirubrobacterales bacterium]|nr:nitrite reductase small subunit NirD [Solirubrobacterales bacterium]
MIRVCAVEDVPPGEGRNVSVGDLRLAVFRTDSGWYATEAGCPHMQGPLADGIVADASVICPLHERRFSLQTGAEINGSLCVKTYRAVVHRDDVYILADVPVLAGA